MFGKKIAVSLVLVLALSGCGQLESHPSPKDISNLCQIFGRTPHKQLLTPNKKKEILKIKNGGGIPNPLKEAIDGYYVNEELNGMDIETFTYERRDRLDAKLNGVIYACHNAGWVE